MSRTIAEMASTLEALSTNATMTAIRREVAIGGVKLTAECFRTSTDPYGVRWPGLKTPRPGGPVEVKSGAMRDATYARPIPVGVRFTIEKPYAGYQHWGTRTNPQRRLLPVAHLGLPEKWKAMVAKAYTTQLRAAMRVR